MESTSVTVEHRPLPTTLTDPTFLVRASLLRRVDQANLPSFVDSKDSK